MPAASVILYCRPGFESECAQEIAAVALTAALTGQVRSAPLAGFVEYRLVDDLAAAAPAKRDIFDVRHLIFARQSLLAFAQIEQLPRADRLTPIIAALTEHGERYSDAWVEAPDTDEGKALAPFCKSFGNALIGALKRAHLLDPPAPGGSPSAAEAMHGRERPPRRLHAFFPQSDNVYLAAADPATSAPWPQGIPRLKFPREAPSRSTLKLDEALLVLLDEAERARWLTPGMSAVDLGAAPGGWTWQFVRRSMRVAAVDNGPMDRKLMDSGLVTHLREDGFRYRPRKAVDWLVCDMVEQPRRVAELVARWLEQGWCKRAIFNLKLPMKKRYEETQRCLDLVRRVSADVRAKQLYHDREEITAFAAAARRG
ncbi:MAG: 23S rRNA (cytidine(2498)-2'-O)-methyltransferase RlmM [Rudaea sp.]|nr:23S rRNA (cytidine(2498)-2'-O)-methyltransferase RlmM [Rudaea sp.]